VAAHLIERTNRIGALKPWLDHANDVDERQEIWSSCHHHVPLVATTPVLRNSAHAGVDAQAQEEMLRIES